MFNAISQKEQEVPLHLVASQHAPLAIVNHNPLR